MNPFRLGQWVVRDSNHTGTVWLREHPTEVSPETSVPHQITELYGQQGIYVNNERSAMNSRYFRAAGELEVMQHLTPARAEEEESEELEGVDDLVETGIELRGVNTSRQIRAHGTNRMRWNKTLDESLEARKSGLRSAIASFRTRGMLNITLYRCFESLSTGDISMIKVDIDEYLDEPSQPVIDW